MEPDQEISLTVNNFNVSMQCGDYNKDFDYHWEKKNEKFHLKAEGVNSHQLIIANVMPEDTGEYGCVMGNSTGKIFSDYLLITIKGLIAIKFMNHSF